MVGNILGANPDAVNIGELNELWRLKASGTRPCGCGKPHEACEFWAAVFDHLRDARHRRSDYVVPLRLREIRLRRLLARRAFGRGGDTDPPTRYSTILSDMYQAIAQVASASLIIDTGKYPGDAFATSQAAGLDAYVLHLVRDPRAVAWSWMRTKRADPMGDQWMRTIPPLNSSSRWTVMNLATEALVRRPLGDRYRLARYEDLVAQPRRAFASLARWVGSDPDALPWVDEHTIALAPGHTAYGNPARFATGPTRIALDERWRTQMPTTARLQALLPALPVMRRYGYLGRERPGG